MASEHYIIRGGVEGRERLRKLSRVMWPTTRDLFARANVSPGMRCLDVGCGGGDLSCDLARLVGPTGAVVGTDIDETKLRLAREEARAQGVANFLARSADIVPDDEVASFDLVYARFVLSHLPDPAGALAKLHRALRPGGVIIVEDIDARGHFCHPDCPAFWRYVALYTEAATRRGVDANIGPRLPGLLLDGGFAPVQMNVVQPAGLDSDTKLLIPLTVENIAESVLAEGLATTDEINRIVDELYAFARDPRTVMSLPRIVQAWGRKPGGSRAAG
jgi:SAM-dependent methyltransferase